MPLESNNSSCSGSGGNSNSSSGDRYHQRFQNTNESAETAGSHNTIPMLKHSNDMSHHQPPPPRSHPQNRLLIPQTVTATMVDPSLSNARLGRSAGHGSGEGDGRTISGSSTYASSNSSGSGSGSRSTKMQTTRYTNSASPATQQQQQQQPTLASLALADSRGQLDSGLGYYEPQSAGAKRAFKAGQHGIHSEPASSAGSPVSFSSGSSGSVFVGRRVAASAEGATAMVRDQQYQKRSDPTTSLGVVFSAPGNAKSSLTTVVYHRKQSSNDDSSQSVVGRAFNNHNNNNRDGEVAMSNSLSCGGGGGGGSERQRGAITSLTASPQVAGTSRGVAGLYSGDDTSHSQLSVLPEDSRLTGFYSNNNRQLAQSTEYAPHHASTSSPSMSAAALAASSSLTFRNSQTQITSSQPISQPYYQQSSLFSSSNRHSTATATSGNRDSMFLRLKEKVKAFKSRARPQSDNFGDRKSGGGGSMRSPSSFNKPSRGNTTGSTSNEAQLFGMSLTFAVKVSGVCVGVISGNDTPCIVPSVVAVCGRYLREKGQHVQGIFRINGSVKRVQKLQFEFNERPLYGREVDWNGYTLHDTATILRRYLITLPESVISANYYQSFLDKLAEPIPDDVKARDFGAMISAFSTESQNTLLYMLDLLSLFAQPENSSRTLMNASNLAAVLQPCLLVHPGHLANPQEYGKAKEVIEFLIVHAAELCASLGSVNGQQNHRYTIMTDDSRNCESEDFVMVGENTYNYDKSARDVPSAGLIIFGPPDTGKTGKEGAEKQSQPAQWSDPSSNEKPSSASSQNSSDLIAAEPTGDPSPRQIPPPPPPRCDSLITRNMVMSTPVMGSTATDGTRQLLPPAPPPLIPPRPYGSVTARLYDPNRDDGDVSPSCISPGMPSAGSPFAESMVSWGSGRSGVTIQNAQQSHGSDSQIVSDGKLLQNGPIPRAARPRRSLSFVAPASSSDRQETAARRPLPAPPVRDSPKEQVDEISQDILDRSTYAVLAARRGAMGERRAGHVKLSANAAVSQHQFQKAPPANNRSNSNDETSVNYQSLRARPLPEVPTSRKQDSTSAASGGGGNSSSISSGTSRSVSSQMGKMWSNEGYHMYPRSQKTQQHVYPAKYELVAGKLHGSDMDIQALRKEARSQTPVQTVRSSTADPRVPESALEREAVRAKNAISKQQNDLPLTTPSNPAGYHRHFSGAQRGKLYPIGQANPMDTVNSNRRPDISAKSLYSGSKGQQQQQQLRKGGEDMDKVTAAAAAGKSRFKSIFRFTSTTSDDNAAALKGPSSMTSMPSDRSQQRQKLQQQQQQQQQLARNQHSFRSVSGSHAINSADAMDFASVRREQFHGQSQTASESDRLQVTVPASHLSIIYPDSPMSKTDTLQRSSLDSMIGRQQQQQQRVSVDQRNRQVSSGHAYLVNPDEEDSRYSLRNQRLESGTAGYSQISNSNTLHSGSYYNPEERRSGTFSGSTTAQTTITTTKGNIPHSAFQPYHMKVYTPSPHGANRAAPATSQPGVVGPSIYGVSRMADSETYLDSRQQRTSNAYVLPDITTNGSPLMSGGFGGLGGEGSPPLAKPHRGNSLRRKRPTDMARDEDYEEGEDMLVVETGMSNRPRRSRSLRNTITSLRRRMSKSSRNGGGSDMSQQPSIQGGDEAVQTA